MAKFCSRCGTPLEDNDVFCANCGARQVADQPVQPAPQAAPAYQQPQAPAYQQPYAAPQQQAYRPAAPAPVKTKKKGGAGKVVVSAI
ncbi:MAG: zinc-ribbon domain-containing protein, partial [Oscillospiraceae bacterium]|nr:zinc-ribbon domain-containing protein [Oscillospiraceae bacterium]